jgi:Ca2+-binding EF-hand superfamily protein
VQLQASTATQQLLSSSSVFPTAFGGVESPSGVPTNGSMNSSPTGTAAAAVSLKLLARYIRSRIHLSNVARRLSHYDSEGDGCLREHDLENYVFESLGELSELSSLQDNFYPFYVFTAVRKFFFTLDPHRIGKVKIADVLSSPILSEWLCLFPPDHPHLIAPGEEKAVKAEDEGAKGDDTAEASEVMKSAAAGEAAEEGSDEKKAAASKKAKKVTAADTVPASVREAARKAAKEILFSLDATRRTTITTTTTTTMANDNGNNSTPSEGGSAGETASGDSSPAGSTASSSGTAAGTEGTTTTTTTTTSYVPAVLPVDEPNGIGLNNWFSAATAIRVYSQYLDLDQDQNGLLSPLELSRACNGTLSDAFIHRLFQASNTYGGEMDFKAYLDFVLATEYRRTPAAMRYTFRALDTKGLGYLSLQDIRFFFSDVSSKMVAAGHESVDAANVSDEIVDMVKRGSGNTKGSSSAGHRGGGSRHHGHHHHHYEEALIHLDDLLKCGVGHTVLQILTDAAGFWQYDNREWLVQQQQQQLQQMMMATSNASTNSNPSPSPQHAGASTPQQSQLQEQQQHGGASHFNSEPPSSGGEGSSSPVSPTGLATADQYREYSGSGSNTNDNESGSSSSSSSLSSSNYWSDEGSSQPVTTSVSGGGAVVTAASSEFFPAGSSTSGFPQHQATSSNNNAGFFGGVDGDGGGNTEAVSPYGEEEDDAAVWGQPAPAAVGGAPRSSRGFSSINHGPSSSDAAASSWPSSPEESDRVPSAGGHVKPSQPPAPAEATAGGDDDDDEGIIEDEAAEIGFE